VSRRRGNRPGDPVGICVVDKPSGWTSHDVVGRLRRVLGTPRVGHAGTLDPMATGVLVVGVGAATKLLTFITGVSKVYEATITFGVETDSLDADGEVTATHDMGQLDPVAVRAAAATLTGPLLQIPPMVSAIRVEGRRLHELARQGIEVERAPRPVTVHRFELRPTEDPLRWDATVECSSGTYVRSLAADLGHALGGGAHLSALRRTAVGPFLLGEATPVDEPVLLDAREGVRHLSALVVDDERAALVRNGRVFDAAELGAVGSGPWSLSTGDGVLLAVYEAVGEDRVKPAVVLSTQAAG
jgi:tRNA pseudouridine55 synthase